MEDDESFEVKSAPTFLNVLVKEEQESGNEEHFSEGEEINLGRDNHVQVKQEIVDEEEVKSDPLAIVGDLSLAQEEENMAEVKSGKVTQGTTGLPSTSKEVPSITPAARTSHVKEEAANDLDDDPQSHVQFDWESSEDDDDDEGESILPGDGWPELHLKGDGVSTGERAEMRQPPSEDGTYNCSLCPYSTFERYRLKNHQRTHTKERPFPCAVCGAAFTVKSSLVTHTRKHTGERPYKCTVCPTTFSHLWNLTKHLRMHSGEKPYACDACPAAFSDVDHLKRHKRVHTGDRPYACDVCSAAFSQMGTLKTHKRVHSGDKPYACDLCSAAFAHSGTLKRHKLTHSGDRSYRCDVCARSFTRKDKLASHMKTH